MSPRSGVLDAPDVTRQGTGSHTARPMQNPELLEPPLRVRRAATLLVITLVLPGSAQLVAGNRRLGRLALKTWGGLVAAALLLVVAALIDRDVLIWLFTKPFVLGLTAVVCFGLAVAWPVLIVDAWRLGRMPLLPMSARRWFALATVLLVLLTALPLTALGRRAWAAESFLGTVFSSSQKSEAVAGRFNVLLLGADSGKSRVGTRPDSITLASIDAATGRTALFSLPRNLENVRFPAGTPAAKKLPKGWDCGDECLLNGIYTWATEHPDAFPGAKDPGAEAMKQVVAETLGVPVNYYVIIDLKGFRSLIDAVGGIDIHVKQRVPMGGGTSRIFGWIEPGRRHLDGRQALWYGRSREGASDYARMARQRCVMQAMLEQLDPATVLSKFQKIAEAGKDVVATDIPAAHLATFIDLAGKARSHKVTSVQFVPPLIKPAYADFALIRSTVQKTIADVERADEKPKAAGRPGTTSAAEGAAAGGPAAKPVATGTATNGATNGATGGATGGAAGAGASSDKTGATAEAVSDVASVCSAG